MNKIWTGICMAALCMFGMTAPAADEGLKPLKLTETPGVPAAFKDADTIVKQGIDDDVFPGAALVVGRGEDVLFAKCYGRQTYETTSPAVTFDTQFDMASCSKIMAPTMGMMKLYEEGKLKFSDPVTKYLPAFAANGKSTTTLEQLVTHCSGLPAYLVHKDIVKIVDAGKAKGLRPDQALINYYCELKPQAPAGTKTIYSCLNMQTMAAIEEKITGMSLESFLRKTVWGDAAMTETTYFPADPKNCMPTIGDVLTSTVTRQGTVHDPLAAAYVSKEHCSGNAGVFSTANDVTRFAQITACGGTVSGKKILAKQTVKDMTELRTTGTLSGRTWGWDIYDEPPYATPLNQTNDTRCVGHTGYTGTLVWIDTRTGIYVVLLTNRVYPDDRDQPAGHLNTSKVRRECARCAIRTIPEYAKFIK